MLSEIWAYLRRCALYSFRFSFSAAALMRNATRLAPAISAGADDMPIVIFDDDDDNIAESAMRGV